MLIVFLIACVWSAEAKLGEAPFECDARYGPPERIFEVLGLKARQYSFKSYRVVVGFENNFSAIEYVAPKNSRDEMSETEVVALIEAVSGTTNWSKFETPRLFKKVARARSEQLQADWAWEILGNHTLTIARHDTLIAANARLADRERAKAAGFGGPVPEPMPAVEIEPKIVIPDRPEVFISVDPRPPSPEQQKIEANRVASLMVQATNGVASAQYDLALRYLNGKGVEKDANIARAWLEKAASKGHTYAKRALATLPPSELVK